MANNQPQVITPDELYRHWKGHRDLTRRVIEAFPEKELFSFSIGGMRTFAALAAELIELTGAGIKGLATENWEGVEGIPSHHNMEEQPKTKEELLRIWDLSTAQLDEYWPKLTLERFHERSKAFGQYDNFVWGNIFYFIDNENHHRGQGYVYLRALGIEPPPFWDRPE